MKRWIILLFLLGIIGVGAASAQQSGASIGKVVAGNTQQPLAYASVFLANTTYGTTTDSTGRFALAGVPPGSYELTVSYLGYALYKKTVVLPAAAPLTVAMQAGTATLNEVVIRPSKNRVVDMKRFLVQFLGRSSLSKQCRIENPDDLIILYDAKSQELTAVSSHPVRVLNNALGYRITYYNFSFKIFYRANRCDFVASPLFTELPSANARQRLQWAAQRRAAYLGSLPHFLRSVRENQVQAEGFVVQRAPEGSKAVAQQPEQGAGAARNKTPQDTLPPPLDVAAYAHIDSVAQLQFAFVLQVVYAREVPDAVYAADVTVARRNTLMTAKEQRWSGAQMQNYVAKLDYEPVVELSQIRLLGPRAVIQPNGYLVNPLSVKVDGYWAFEKVGEALPLDYQPETSGPATATGH